MIKRKKLYKHESGVTFCSYGTQNSRERGPAAFLKPAVGFLLAFLTTLGLLFSFTDAFEIAVAKTALLLFAALFSALFCFVFEKRQNGSKWILVVPLVLFSYLFIYFFNDIVKEFIYAANVVMKSVEWYYEIELSAIPYPSFLGDPKTSPYGREIFFIMISCLLSYGAAYVVYGGKRVFYILLTLPFIALPLACGLIPGGIYLALFAVAAIALLGNGFAAQTGIRMQVKLVLMMTMGVLLLMLSLAFPKGKYEQVFHIYEIKKNVQLDIQEFIDSNHWPAIFPFARDAAGGLSKGVLGDVSEISFHKEEVLKVTVPAAYKTAFYLKGYVGTRYSSDKWLPQKQNAEDAAPANFALVLNQLLSALPMDDNAGKDSAIARELKALYAELLEYPPSAAKWMPDSITVENTRRGDRTLYVPYDAQESFAYKNDGTIKGSKKLAKSKARIFQPMYLYNHLQMEYLRFFQSRAHADMDTIEKIIQLNPVRRQFYEEYLGMTLEAYAKTKHPSRPEMDSVIDSILSLDAYLKQEADYQRFVYEAYTVLPKEGVPNAIKAFQEQYIPPLEDSDYLQNAILQVTSFLKEHAAYSLSPGITPAGKDFVDYFLLENKAGYCSHFATAATLLLRSVGIPSRYVEGYVVTVNDYHNGGLQNGERLLSIRDTNAHAWTEVYRDGYGWVPIETTPGFEQGSLPLQVSRSASPNASAAVEQAAHTGNAPAWTPSPVPVNSHNSSLKNTSPILYFLEKTGRTLSFFLLPAAAGLLLIFLRSKLCQLKRQSILKEEDYSRRQLFYHKLLRSALKNEYSFHGAAFLFEETELPSEIHISKKDLELFLSISNKAAYAPGRISEKEWEQGRRIYENYISLLYKDASGIRRFFYKYILLIR